MSQSILITITVTVLLATTLNTFTVKACPLGSGSGSGDDCTQECQAYKDAEAATSPVYLNVNATPSNFLNTPREFNSKLGTDYEEDSIEGRPEACYLDSNAEAGCKEFLEVDGACSWTYQCDYNKNRLPLYMWRASCASESETIYYPVPVLKRSDSCNPKPTWELVMEKVPVGCSCRT